MRKSICINAEAEDEISHAIDRYEEEREGLGAEFWGEVRNGDAGARSSGTGVRAGARTST